MNNIVLFVVFVTGLVFFQYIQSHNVDDIINNYFEERGGKQKINALRSLYMEGLREMIGQQVPIKISIVQNEYYRTDFEINGTKGYLFITPNEGWYYNPLQSRRPEPLPLQQLNTLKDDMDIAGALLNYASKGHKAELKARESINGKTVNKIYLTLKNGNQIIYFIEKESDLLVQTKKIILEDGKAPFEIVTNYDDYKFVDGILFPHTITNPSEGIMAGVITFTSIQVNKPVDKNILQSGIVT